MKPYKFNRILNQIMLGREQYNYSIIDCYLLARIMYNMRSSVFLQQYMTQGVELTKVKNKDNSFNIVIKPWR